MYMQQARLLLLTFLLCFTVQAQLEDKYHIEARGYTSLFCVSVFGYINNDRYDCRDTMHKIVDIIQVQQWKGKHELFLLDEVEQMTNDKDFEPLINELYDLIIVKKYRFNLWEVFYRHTQNKQKALTWIASIYIATQKKYKIEDFMIQEIKLNEDFVFKFEGVRRELNTKKDFIDLYPKKLTTLRVLKDKSYRVYHFYVIAYLSLKLRQAGFQKWAQRGPLLFDYAYENAQLQNKRSYLVNSIDFLDWFPHYVSPALADTKDLIKIGSHKDIYLAYVASLWASNYLPLPYCGPVIMPFKFFTQMFERDGIYPFLE
jgi:hypothetical protein